VKIFLSSNIVNGILSLCLCMSVEACVKLGPRGASFSVCDWITATTSQHRRGASMFLGDYG